MSDESIPVVPSVPAPAVSAGPPAAPAPRRRWRRGSALAAIGVALLGGVAWFGWIEPKLRGQWLHANESFAIAALKNISSAQSQLQASGFIDTDGNGAGEFGFFAELAGAAIVRGKRAGEPNAIVAPAVLSPRFGAVERGRVCSGGYVFQMFLRGRDGSWVAEADRGGSEGRLVDGAAAEAEWLCYAWPIEYGRTGKRTFLITQGGDVLAFGAREHAYEGDRCPGPGESGFARARDGTLAANSADVLGDTWVVV